MSDGANWPDRLDRYLLGRIRCGDDGKTLLLGVQRGQIRFAIAAGLRGEQDHPLFLAFVRYLLHHRFACDGFALMRPALVADEPLYALQVYLDGESSAWLIRADGARRAWAGDQQLIAEVAHRRPALSGIQRRDLDGLYEELKLPLP